MSRAFSWGFFFSMGALLLHLAEVVENSVVVGGVQLKFEGEFFLRGAACSLALFFGAIGMTNMLFYLFTHEGMYGKSEIIRRLFFLHSQQKWRKI